MAATAAAAVVDLDGLRASVTKQAAEVRRLKAEGADAATVQTAVETLQTLRKQLDALSATQEDVNKWKVNKRALEDTLARRMFVVPAFEIHGGVAGLYDYGPPGCSLKENILSLWRQHFILEDNMLQIECTTLTPYPVLKASGHVDKFEDLMVKDTKTGECYRADKLLEDVIEHKLASDKELTTERREELRVIAAQADAYEPADLHRLFTELGIKAPATGNDLTEPFPFNLMFQTSIGPTGQLPGFLRPETAQGMFVNFRRLYDYNNARMPMAVAQIGSAYRNEIAPRGGLIRVREFTMAEIEYFVHPEHKQHTKFDSVKHLKLQLFPSDNQVGDGKTLNHLTLEEAVRTKVIDNETLAYFMARTALFMYRIGVKPEGLRFRQHLRTEMAHYAADCWDAEILMAQGWVECVGHADRSAYDLEVHTKASKVELVAREAYAEPRDETVMAMKPNKGLMGKTFKGDNAAVVSALEEVAADQDKALAFQAQLDSAGSATVEAAGKTHTITKDMVSFATETRKVSERKYTPNVIEPSFGIGRIITGVFEHNFYVREGDEQRAVLSFKPIVAPFKAVLLPLDGRLDKKVVAPIGAALVAAGISNYVDDSSASVGKRYARADEIGVPFAVTYDHASATDGCVTLRERDTTGQLRLPIADLPKVLKGLCDETLSWSAIVGTYGGLIAATGAPATATSTSGGASGGAGAAAAATVSSGTRGVKLENTGRTVGRFFRPADL